MTSARHIFSGMQLLIGQQWEQGKALVIENKTIKAIIPENMIEHHLPAKHHHFTHQHYLVPGFIDLHIHGANGKDVMDGDLQALSIISNALAAEGVTGYLATTMTAKREKIEKVLSIIPEAMQNKTGAAILGVHLEGPFLSPDKLGAQNTDIENPNADLLTTWQRLAQENIKLITLAPELLHAFSFIETLRDTGVVLSIGHSNATYQETTQAIEAGCSHATHLFNAMRGIYQREPGTVGALLLSNLITAEVIVDGLHLHPAIVELCYRLIGKDRLILVTDAMRAKCLGDGSYELGGQIVTVEDGKAMLPNQTLAGSLLTMPQAIKNMVEFTRCSLIDAIHMATRNPAQVLQVADKKGLIEIGKDADLVVLNESFEPVLTMREGNEIYVAISA